MNIWTNCGPASFKKVDFVWAAQARANNVLPENLQEKLGDEMTKYARFLIYQFLEGHIIEHLWEAEYQGSQISLCVSSGGQLPQ